MHRLFLVLCLLTLAVVVVFGEQASADNCRRVATTNAVYSSPLATYSAPVTAYQAPVVSYQAYAAQTLVPYAEKILINKDFYFSVGDEFRQLAFAKLVAQELAAIQSQSQPQQKANTPIQPLGPSSGAVQSAPKEALVVQPTTPAKPVVGDGSECKPVTTAMPEGFKELVAAKCQKCHTSGEAKRRCDLTDIEGLSHLSLSARDRMFRSVSNGRMPKGQKISDTELNLFNAYASLAESAVYGEQKQAIPKAKE